MRRVYWISTSNKTKKRSYVHDFYDQWKVSLMIGQEMALPNLPGHDRKKKFKGKLSGQTPTFGNIVGERAQFSASK